MSTSVVPLYDFTVGSLTFWHPFYKVSQTPFWLNIFKLFRLTHWQEEPSSFFHLPSFIDLRSWVSCWSSKIISSFLLDYPVDYTIYLFCFYLTIPYLSVLCTNYISTENGNTLYKLWLISNKGLVKMYTYVRANGRHSMPAIFSY